MSERISQAKKYDSGAQVIGSQKEGGLVRIDGQGTFALKHESLRLNGEKVGDYTTADLVPYSFKIEPIPNYPETLRSVTELTNMLEGGILPENFTLGMEVEGTTYDHSIEPKSVYSEKFAATDYDHPELLNITLETATTDIDGQYPKNPVEIAKSLSNSILGGIKIAESANTSISYASVPEAGDGNSPNIQITDHPYLIRFAPTIAKSTLSKINEIPPEVLDVYQKAGIDIVTQINNGLLHWPVNALHVHTGLPVEDEFSNPRISHAMGMIRLTEFSKLVSLTLYNTRHFYGSEIENTMDVRSVIRRLLSSSHNRSIPLDTESLISKTISQLKNGQIHSPARFPASGQHDALRLRSDKNTTESIDAPMNPDLRKIVAWACFQQIGDVIALDALKETNGDESKTIMYLKVKWGDIFSLIPTMGERSSFSQDIEFGKKGYEGTSNTGLTFRDSLGTVQKIIFDYAKKYPAIAVNAAIVLHHIKNELSIPGDQTDLVSYFGVETGKYYSNGKNLGPLTSLKRGRPKEIVAIQAEATKLQAKMLSTVSDQKDLFEFLGIDEV